MLAISYVRDQISLQSSKIWFRKIRPEIIATWLLEDLPHCKHIWSLYGFWFEIASIKGPYCFHDCKHIWSQLILSLPAYLITFIKIIAIISYDSYVSRPYMKLKLHVGWKLHREILGYQHSNFSWNKYINSTYNQTSHSTRHTCSCFYRIVITWPQDISIHSDIQCRYGPFLYYAVLIVWEYFQSRVLGWLCI